MLQGRLHFHTFGKHAHGGLAADVFAGEPSFCGAFAAAVNTDVVQYLVAQTPVHIVQISVRFHVLRPKHFGYLLADENFPRSVVVLFRLGAEVHESLIPLTV